MSQPTSVLGCLFMQLRDGAACWRALLFAALAGLVAANLFVWPAHPHFAPESWLPGFWGLFGLAGACGMGFFLKKVAFPALGRDPNDPKKRVAHPHGAHTGGHS